MKARDWRPWAVTVTLLALATFVAWRRYQFLAESPFPLGIDGYFYPIQLRSIMETGWIDSPSSPLGFFLMVPFAWATDPIVGAKLGAAVWCAAAVFPAYGVATRLSGFRTTGLVAATLVGLSHGGFYLTIEFVKNGIGITVALSLLWLLLRTLETPSRGRWIGCAAAVVAASLTHKIAAPLALLFAAPAIVVVLRTRKQLSRNIMLGGAATFIAVGAIAVRAGWSELHKMFSSHAYWDLPALALPRKSLMMGDEPRYGALAAIFIVLSAIKLWRSDELRQRLHVVTVEQRMALATTLAFATFALFLALPWLDAANPQGLTFRLRIIAFVPLAMCTAVALAWAARFVATAAPTVRVPLAPAFASLAAATVLWWSPARIEEGVVLAHPAMVAAIQGLHDQLPAGVFVIVPERHIAFMTAWYTRARVRLRPESAPEANRMRLVTLAFIGAGSALEHTIDLARVEPSVMPPIGTHPLHINGLVLISEPTWSWILAALPPNLRARPQAWPTI